MGRFNCNWTSFIASNIRNIMTAINRLEKEDKEIALVAACADSGLANAMLIKRN